MRKAGAAGAARAAGAALSGGPSCEGSFYCEPEYPLGMFCLKRPFGLQASAETKSWPHKAKGAKIKTFKACGLAARREQWELRPGLCSRLNKPCQAQSRGTPLLEDTGTRAARQNATRARGGPYNKS